MEFQTITIEDTINSVKSSCLVERLSSSDLGYETKKSWKVFLHYTIVNDVPRISDVYCCDDVKSAIWPTPGAASSDYYDSYEEFTSDMSSFSSVSCSSTIYRVWIPSQLKKTDFIMHFSSTINSTKFHWCIKDLSTCERNVGKMRKHGHDWYVEYVDVEVPSITSFFSSSSYIVFPGRVKLSEEEVQNQIVKFTDSNGNQITPAPKRVYLNEAEFMLLSNDVRSACEVPEPGKYLLTYWNLPDGASQLVRTSCLLRKWKISKYADGTNQTELVGSVENPDRSPVSCILFPWSSVTDHLYRLSDECSIGTCTYSIDNTISLSASVEFVNGRVCVVGKFKHPGTCTLQQWYESAYDVKLSDYPKKAEEVAELADEIDTLEGRPEMCGYKMTVALDKNMQQVLHKEEAYDNKIDDFCFPMIDLFSDWNEVPASVWVQVKLIDRYIGLSLASDPHLLTKDELKYMMTETREGRASELPLLQLYDEEHPYAPIEYNKDIEVEMSEQRPFFIDNIRCYVTRENSDVRSSTKSQYKPRIVYKPIFYRTEEGQTVKVRNKMVQNVGINLSKYMTRVDTFYMRVNGTDFVEIARNGIYVIFEVNAMTTEMTDTYDIIDDEGNYITTGSITLI